MENALLAKESRERNKILECLLAFEKKDQHSSATNNSKGESSSGPNMSKAKKLIDMQDMQNVPKTKSDEDLGYQVNKAKQNNDASAKSKKKSAVRRKKKKTLWDNDSTMFAE